VLLVFSCLLSLDLSVCFDFRSGCCVLRCALHSTLRIFSSRWFVSVPSFCRPLGFSHRYFRFCAPVDFPFSLKPSFLLFVSYSIFPSRFATAGPQQARALVGPVKYGRVPRLLRCFAAAVFRSARQVSLVEQHAPVSVFGFVPRLRFLFQVATPASSCLLWICSIPRADFIPAHDFVRLTFM
jgi:hypothetical protein